MDLVGVNGTAYGSTSHTFDVLSSILPTGLVEDDNYFDIGTGPGGCGVCDFAGVNFWQGVSVTGLSAGDYQFSFTNPAGTTVVFEPWDDTIGAPFTLEAGDIGTSAVPLPAALPLLLGALGAFGFLRRRKTA